MILRELTRPARASDPVVIGDSKDVDTARRGPHEILGGLGAVAPP